MQYMQDWIATEADLLLSDWEAIDSIIYDEALEADSSNTSDANSIGVIERDGKVDPTASNKSKPRSTSTIMDRIKQFFDNLLMIIDRFFSEITSKFQKIFISDREFQKTFNTFRKQHGLKKGVNVQNGTYDAAYIDNVISNTTTFISKYTSALEGYYSEFHNKIMSNTADADTVNEIDSKIQKMFGGDPPLIALGKAIGINVQNGVNVHYMYNEIHNKFIGETKVISIGSDGDPKYVRDAENYLRSYNEEYRKIHRTINVVNDSTKKMNEKIKQMANASNSQFKTANTLSQRVSDYCKTAEASISILRLTATCVIEKAVNSRMILQRAYGF